MELDLTGVTADIKDALDGTFAENYSGNVTLNDNSGDVILAYRY